MTPEQFKRRIIADIRVELTDEFDKNFERKAFFSQKWKPRKNPAARGSLLNVSGALRRSIKAEETANGVRFSSQVRYASAHNEGTTTAGRGHRTVIPQRQFIGDSPEVRQIIEDVVTDAVHQFAHELAKSMK